jgi:hypothetical protein
MTTFARWLALASGQGEVFDLAREMIGTRELALLLAKAAVKNTTAEELSPTKVARATGLTDRGARNKIFNAAVMEKQ